MLLSRFQNSILIYMLRCERFYRATSVKFDDIFIANKLIIFLHPTYMHLYTV